MYLYNDPIVALVSDTEKFEYEFAVKAEAKGEEQVKDMRICSRVGWPVWRAARAYSGGRSDSDPACPRRRGANLPYTMQAHDASSSNAARPNMAQNR